LSAAHTTSHWGLLCGSESAHSMCPETGWTPVQNVHVSLDQVLMFCFLIDDIRILLIYLANSMVQGLPWKALVTQMVRKFAAFKESKGSILHLQKPTIGLHVSKFNLITYFQRLIVILSTHINLGVSSGFFPSSVLTKILYALPIFPSMLDVLHISFSWFNQPNNITWMSACSEVPHNAFFSILLLLPLSKVQIFSAHCSQTYLINVFPSEWETKYHIIQNK
jgi:hypothetical protein